MARAVTESNSNKPISIRFDQEDLYNYKSLTNGAGIVLAEGVRQLMTEKLKMAEELKMEGFSVKIKFSKSAQYEHVGDLVAKVTPPKGLSAEVLDRIIFIVPEFFNDQGALPIEPFRIDSAYFHRVTSAKSIIESKKTSRNVLSFHLYKNQWRAGIYDYGSQLSFTELKQRIENSLVSHITDTIRCYLINHLPQTRVMTEDEFQERVKHLDNTQLDIAMNLDPIG